MSKLPEIKTPGFWVNCWGYNGSSPGPTIEAVEGDRVRILVTNKLNEPTSVHWHGIILPNGMDGVAGLNQKAIPPGDTFKYEFTLKQNGTFMYHPHSDEMIQIIKTSPKLVKYFDMPLQHISDSMLKRMNRKMTKAEIVERVEKIKDRKSVV